MPASAEGNAGADYFVFRPNFGSTDTITDFQDGIDRIRMEGFAGLTDASQLAIVYDAAGAYFSYSGNPGQYVRVSGIAAGSLSNADFNFV